ncbi:hypothetical protein C8J56DRAFT_898507 [Mycena floridula]|nr:hypothetical protein C8J56DRAFT_898507 [Mycena floridula]
MDPLLILLPRIENGTTAYQGRPACICSQKQTDHGQSAAHLNQIKTSNQLRAHPGKKADKKTKELPSAFADGDDDDEDSEVETVRSIVWSSNRSNKLESQRPRRQTRSATAKLTPVPPDQSKSKKGEDKAASSKVQMEVDGRANITTEEEDVPCIEPEPVDSSLHLISTCSILFDQPEKKAMITNPQNKDAVDLGIEANMITQKKVTMSDLVESDVDAMDLDVNPKPRSAENLTPTQEQVKAMDTQVEHSVKLKKKAKAKGKKEGSEDEEAQVDTDKPKKKKRRKSKGKKKEASEDEGAQTDGGNASLQEDDFEDVAASDLPGLLRRATKETKAQIKATETAPVILSNPINTDYLDPWTIGFAAGLGNHPNLAFDAPTLIFPDIREPANLQVSTDAVLESLGPDGVNMKAFLPENMLIIFIKRAYLKLDRLQSKATDDLFLVEFTKEAQGKFMELGAGHSRLNALKTLYLFLRTQYETLRDALMDATKNYNKDGLSDKKGAKLKAERERLKPLVKEARTAYLTANRWGIRFIDIDCPFEIRISASTNGLGTQTPDTSDVSARRVIRIVGQAPTIAISDAVKEQFLLKPKGVEEAALLVKELPGLIDALGKLSRFSPYSKHPLDVRLLLKSKKVVAGAFQVSCDSFHEQARLLACPIDLSKYKEVESCQDIHRVYVLAAEASDMIVTKLSVAPTPTAFAVEFTNQVLIAFQQQYLKLFRGTDPADRLQALGSDAWARILEGTYRTSLAEVALQIIEDIPQFWSTDLTMSDEVLVDNLLIKVHLMLTHHIFDFKTSWESQITFEAGYRFVCGRLIPLVEPASAAKDPDNSITHCFYRDLSRGSTRWMENPQDPKFLIRNPDWDPDHTEKEDTELNEKIRMVFIHRIHPIYQIMGLIFTHRVQAFTPAAADLREFLDTVTVTTTKDTVDRDEDSDEDGDETTEDTLKCATEWDCVVLWMSFISKRGPQQNLLKVKSTDVNLGPPKGCRQHWPETTTLARDLLDACTFDFMRGSASNKKIPKSYLAKALVEVQRRPHQVQIYQSYQPIRYIHATACRVITDLFEGWVDWTGTDLEGTDKIESFDEQQATLTARRGQRDKDVDAVKKQMKAMVTKMKGESLLGIPLDGIWSIDRPPPPPKGEKPARKDRSKEGKAVAAESKIHFGISPATALLLTNFISGASREAYINSTCTNGLHRDRESLKVQEYVDAVLAHADIEKITTTDVVRIQFQRALADVGASEPTISDEEMGDVEDEEEKEAERSHSTISTASSTSSEDEEGSLTRNTHFPHFPRHPMSPPIVVKDERKFTVTAAPAAPAPGDPESSEEESQEEVQAFLADCRGDASGVAKRDRSGSETSDFARKRSKLETTI